MAVERLPDAARGCRHVDVADAGLAVERVNDGIDHGRRRSDRTGFAAAFGATGAAAFVT